MWSPTPTASSPRWTVDPYGHRRLCRDIPLHDPLASARWHEDRDDGAANRREQRKRERRGDAREQTGEALADGGVLQQSRDAAVQVIQHEDRPAHLDRWTGLPSRTRRRCGAAATRPSAGSCSSRSSRGCGPSSRSGDRARRTRQTASVAGMSQLRSTHAANPAGPGTGVRSLASGSRVAATVLGLRKMPITAARPWASARSSAARPLPGTSAPSAPRATTRSSSAGSGRPRWRRGSARASPSGARGSTRGRIARHRVRRRDGRQEERKVDGDLLPLGGGAEVNRDDRRQRDAEAPVEVPQRGAEPHGQRHDLSERCRPIRQATTARRTAAWCSPPRSAPGSASSAW